MAEHSKPKAKPKSFHQLKVAAVSLGCAKNLVDTEEVLGFLRDAGAHFVPALKRAQVIFVNTCGFIEEAQQEAVNTLLKIGAGKVKGRQHLVAAGCLVEVFGRKLLTMLPEIDGAIGTQGYRHLKPFLKAVLKGLRPYYKDWPALTYRGLKTRALSGSAHLVNVRIAEGCNNRCSYCLIPLIRGPQRSRPQAEILAEVKSLLAGGTKEIVLLAQDTTAYGLDNHEGSLSELVAAILKNKGAFWLRIMYTNPAHFDEELLRLMAEDNRLCRYLDIPIQHADDTVLKLMGRRYNKSDLANLLERVRRAVPGIYLRTTLMVGFPGERKKAFDNLLAFLRRHPFEHLGTFTYSAQKNTKACGLNGQVPKRLAQKRRNTVMARQQKESLERNLKLVGQKVTVLVDAVHKTKPGLYLGHTEFQAPEADGQVVLRSERTFKPGDFVQAKIIAAAAYDLLARAEQ